MKLFLRDHSYDSMRMMVTQCAISIFGLILALACGMADNDMLRTVCSAFSILFYLFLIYTMLWDIGAKDQISVEYGHKEYRPHTGLGIALLANIPNYLFAIGILLGNLFPDITIFSNIGGGCKFLSLIMQGMYTGLLAIRIGGEHLNMYILSYFIIPLPAILTGWAAYFFGVKGKKFTRLFEWKNGNNHKRGK